jgi:hypothetical protein
MYSAFKLDVNKTSPIQDQKRVQKYLHEVAAMVGWIWAVGGLENWGGIFIRPHCG